MKRSLIAIFAVLLGGVSLWHQQRSSNPVAAHPAQSAVEKTATAVQTAPPLAQTESKGAAATSESHDSTMITMTNGATHVATASVSEPTPRPSLSQNVQSDHTNVSVPAGPNGGSGFTQSYGSGTSVITTTGSYSTSFTQVFSVGTSNYQTSP